MSRHPPAEYARIEERDAKIAALYLQGVPQYQIAMRIGYDRTAGAGRVMVCNSLKRIRENWLQSSLLDFNERKALELAKLDRLESKAWELLEKSEKEKVSSEEYQELADALNAPAKNPRGRPKKKRGGKSSLKVKKEEMIGDSRYMQIIIKCIEMRCKITDLLKPEPRALGGEVSQVVSVQYVINPELAPASEQTVEGTLSLPAPEPTSPPPAEGSNGDDRGSSPLP